MRWYLTASPAPYRPATWKGSWNTTQISSFFDRCVDPVKWGLNSFSTAGITSAVATVSPFTAGVNRFVSRQLATQTISGTFDVLLACRENNAAADFYWRVYVYVTQGASDAVRGVLLDYIESAGGGGTEWPVGTYTATALQAAQAMTPVNAQQGDYLVIEIGYAAYNAAPLPTSYQGQFRYGVRDFTGPAWADATVGSTASDVAPYVEFSNDIALSPLEPTNLAPEVATPLTTFPYEQSHDPVNLAYELWFSYTAPSNGGIGFFAGQASAGSNYAPYVNIYDVNIDFYPVPLAYQEQQKPYVIATPAGSPIYMQATPSASAGAPSTGLLVVQANVLPPPPADLTGYFLINQDDPDTDLYASYLFDPTTGTIVNTVYGIPSGERYDAFPTGLALLADSVDPANVWFFDMPTLTVQTPAISGASVADPFGREFTQIARDATQFYVARYRIADNVIVVSTVQQDGTVAAEVWTIPYPTTIVTPGINAAAVQLAVNAAGTIAYYVVQEDLPRHATIYRYDLVTSANLGVWYTVAVNDTLVTDIWALSNGTFLVAIQEGTFVPGLTQVVRILDANGTVLTTIDALSYPGTTGFYIDHATPTEDEQSVWIWMQDSYGADSANNLYLRVRLSDGVLLSSFSGPGFDAGVGQAVAPGDLPTTLFGPPHSCPLIMLLTGAVPPPTPCPGIVTAARIGV